MATRSIDKGVRGEDIAARFLVSRGCALVDRNARVGSDEIDLVVRDGAVLVAVEVKTSTNGDDPIEAVDEEKFARLARAVTGYRSYIGRIDVIGVAVEPGGATVRWLRGVD